MDFIYIPFAQHPVAGMFVMLRASGEPEHLLKSVRDAVQAIDPNLPIFETGSYQRFYHDQVRGAEEVTMEIVITMGLVGLVLAVVGLYGLVAYNVNRRTREIGIRSRSAQDNAMCCGW